MKKYATVNPILRAARVIARMRSRRSSEEAELDRARQTDRRIK